jgi:hypothetical protein
LTTLRQIRGLVTPLLARHSDLVLVGPYLLIRPVHHVARSIVIDRTGSADVFQPATASVDLLAKRNHFGLGTGERIFRGTGPGPIWRWSDPAMPADFYRILEEDALPRLRSVRTLRGFYEYAEQIHDIHFPFFWSWRAAMKIAMNQLDEARDILNDPRWEKDSGAMFNREVEGLGDRLKARGSNIARKDKLALVDILHQWEAYSVEKLKLAAIWERTPFPLEEQH